MSSRIQVIVTSVVVALFTAVAGASASAQSRIESVLNVQRAGPSASLPTKFYRLAPLISVAQNGADRAIGPPDSAGPYVTVCVRTCDGYYFPIRQNALRRHFRSDAAACQARCSSETRLYHYPRAYGRPQTMLDANARRYADEPNAFAYRTALKPDCTCKAPPWSLEAAARHQKYAEAEAVEIAKDKAFLAAAPTAVAPPQSAQPVADNRSGLVPSAGNAPIPVEVAAVNTSPGHMLPPPRRPLRTAPPNYRAKFKIKPAGLPGFSKFADNPRAAAVWRGGVR